MLDPIVLASGSIRRREFFKLLGLQFNIMPPSIREDNINNLPPREFAEDLAKRKVEKVVSQLSGRLPLWMCSADTLVAFEGNTIGKSADRESAKRTLEQLNGKQHEVITAVALLNGKTLKLDCRSVTSHVTFADMTPDEIEWYLDTCEWQGAAGAYKIQGLGACFVKEIRGSYSCIVGLPLHEFRIMLLENGYPFE